MPRIFLGNLDFEHELAATGAASVLRHGSPIRTTLPAASDRDWVWVAVAQADDFVLTSGKIDKADFSPLAELGLPIPDFADATSEASSIHRGRLTPWGWTDGARELASARGWECVAPPTEVVRQVNSRRFRYCVEREWQIGLPEMAVTSSLDELEAIIQRHGNVPRGWLLKANFGMSGREARRGRGARLDDNTRNWAQRRFDNAGPIIVEPIVERVAEAGIQIDIPQTGEPVLLGVTPLLVDRSGVYRGSRFACPSEEMAIWKPAVETGLRVARQLQQLGYFGPLGTDAMLYRDDAGNCRLRPLQDLNARYTMGRLALGFRRMLPADWCGSWLHFGEKQLAGRTTDSWINDACRLLPPEVCLVSTSPRKIGTRSPSHCAVLVMAPSVEVLGQCEPQLLASLGIGE